MNPAHSLGPHTLERTSGAPLRSGNRLGLLRNANQTYDDWLTAIAGARKWIHFENYIFKGDTIGRRFADALAERAQAGVVVRVLYDWFGSHDVRRSFWNELRARGIDVRPINPLRLAEPLAAIQRDHRKLIAIDGEYASIGGVGVADPWLQRAPGTNLPYRDTCVSVEGPAVADIERAFADVWDRNGSPLPMDERPDVDSIALVGDRDVRVVIQEPGRMRMSRVLQALTASAEERIWVADAYFLAAWDLREGLIAAARDGVDVRLLLPSTSDLYLVGPLSRSGYRRLIEEGVRIWEYQGPMMHAKTFVADGWCSRIGSTNLTVTGLVTNWEIDVIIEDREFALDMERTYLADLEDAREVIPYRGRVSRTFARRQRPRQLMRGSGSEATASLASLGGAVVQGAALDVFRAHEERLTGIVGAGTLAAALLGLVFPRVLAIPVATLLGLVGITGLSRAIRESGERRSAARRRPPDIDIALAPAPDDDARFDPLLDSDAGT
ncbi:MAG: phospholipase D-like domain-containing protein [Dehalococcoidia bacterium]